MDYIQKTSFGMYDNASEAIEAAKEKHQEAQITGETPDNSKEVEAGESIQDLMDMTVGPSDEPPETEGHDSYARQRAFKQTKDGISLKVPDQFEKANETKERLEEIAQVNNELERQGHQRRYVTTDADAPGDAFIHEDAFGKYYYKQLDMEVRPSDVATYAGAEAFGALNESQKAASTIQMMMAIHGSPLMDANTLKAAQSWLERNMVLTDNDPGSRDTFSYDFKDKIATALSEVNSKSKNTETNRTKS